MKILRDCGLVALSVFGVICVAEVFDVGTAGPIRAGLFAAGLIVLVFLLWLLSEDIADYDEWEDYKQ